MFSLLTSAFLLFSFSKCALALSSCVVFDSSWNLLVFGLNGKDWSAGTQDAWASGTASDITATGRPPFDGTGTTCYLSQFGNLIYVMGADKSNPTSIAVYDVAGKSWFTQAASTGEFDPTKAIAILDHDTDVFYAFGAGEMWSLTMDTLKAAKSDPIPWITQGAATFTTTGYDKPVMALANNHVHFINVPNVPAGSADIFVIHFAFFQVEPQAYGNFPASHGQTASVFLADGVQQEFIYIPDDGSATYVINVLTNTTQSLPGPATKDASAMYFAAPDTFVQLTSSGAVSFMPYKAGTPSVSTSWTPVQNLASLPSGSTPGGSASSGGSSTGSGSSTTKARSPGSTATKTSSGTGASSSSTGTNNNGASSSRSITFSMTGALLVGILASSLL
ncbi:hypothetical protein C8J56DRAFT_848436 [Mycena floridula]|nr:hypothetical protein C8J56DRAFT_848436 [Mycena floridula]